MQQGSRGWEGGRVWGERQAYVHVGHSVCPRICMSLCLQGLSVPLCDNTGWQSHTSGTQVVHKKTLAAWGPRVAWRERFPRALPSPPRPATSSNKPAILTFM